MTCLFSPRPIPGTLVPKSLVPESLVPESLVTESLVTEKVPWRFRSGKNDARNYLALRAAYRSMNWRRKYDALGECGARASVERSMLSGRLRIRCNRCQLSACPACSREKMHNFAANLRYAMQTARHRIRFMTLTMRQSDLPLYKQITRIQAHFRQLRKFKFFRHAVKNLVWTLEIKLGKKGLWNIHFHALWEGRFIRQADLAAAWLQITGDSEIVDVRATNERAPIELTKYISKSHDLAIFKPENSDKLHEYLLATHRRRTIGVIGRQWRDLRLTTKWKDPPGEEGEETWLFVGNLSDIINMAESGDMESREILRQVLPRWTG